MFVGPVFTREAVIAPRRTRMYVYRAVYVTALFVLMCTAWLVLAGTQIIRNVGDMARFGSILFQVLAWLQLALVVFLSAVLSASAVSQEKDRQTLILLLMTRLTNHELVLGKLLASLLNVLVMLAAALPVFMFVVLFGGVSFAQVARVFAVTLVASLAAGSLGSTMALWREKTFQTLALTALVLVLWIGAWYGVGEINGTDPVLGIPFISWSTGFSPVRAIVMAASPIPYVDPTLGVIGNGVNLFLLSGSLLTAALNLIAILRVRVWNPEREVRRVQREQAEGETIWGVEHDLAQQTAKKKSKRRASAEAAETARAGHVDARVRTVSEKSREVWDNPVLWREMRTWAYGRKVIVIRVAYLLLFALAAVGLQWTISTGAALRPADELSTAIPAAAMPLVPFFLVSLVIVNALAVNAITNERDGRSLDLLLVTDLSPKEFVFGKIGGVFWITREMVFLPMLLCMYLWWQGGLNFENLIYVLGGLVVMNFFVAMLGIHCGVTYANSKSAIGVSLGTVFFLFLGAATCILIMISFSSGSLSFQTQLAPFLAFILGGGVGLYVSLGARNPSQAIFWAAVLLPLATFYAITSFLLGKSLYVFLPAAATYGFTTLAMLMPAIGEFDIAMGRTKTADDE